MSSFHPRSRQPSERQDDLKPAASPTPGRTTAVPAYRANVTAQIVRAAQGALRRYRALAPALAAGESADPMATLDARGALRRVDEAIAQLGRLLGRDPQAGPAREQLIAERDAIAPATGTQPADRGAARRQAAWKADAAPMASRLALGTVELQVGDEARAITDAKGANGVAQGDKVYLHPDRVEPGTDEGREVLAHELVHLAQARVPGTEADQGDRDEAELEAASLAPSLAGGGLAHAPRRFIDLSRPAADKDAAKAKPKEPETISVHVGPTDVLANAQNYLYLNQNHLWDAIRVHLSTVQWPSPHPRMTWVNRLPFFKALFERLKPMVFPFDDPTELRQLLNPQDPYPFVDGVRPIAGGEKPGPPLGSSKLPRGGAVGFVNWRPAVGTAVGQLFEQAIVDSARRLAPRWLEAADAKAANGSAAGLAVEVEPGGIPLSHHLDRALVHAMSAPGTWDIAADMTRLGKKPQPARGIQKVKLEYMGDPKKGGATMWNWVRATPADATAEDVAAELFAYTAESYGEKNTSFLAYGLTAAPPMFGVPGSWARHLPEMLKHAPATPAANEDGHHAHHAVLADSPVTEELALIEAKDEKPAKLVPGTEKATAATLVDDCVLAASYIAEVLRPWGFAAPVAKTLKFLDARRVDVANPTNATRWQSVLEGQLQNLSAIGSAITTIERSAKMMVGSKRTSPEAAPLREILEVYADAAASSQLVDTSRRLIQEAGRLQIGLTLRSVQGSSREVTSSMDGAHDAKVNDPAYEKEAARLAAEQRRLSSKLIAGGTVSSAEVEDYTLSSGELALRARMDAVRVQLRAMEIAANEAGDGYAAAFASLFSGEFRNLSHNTKMLQMEIWGVEDSFTQNYANESRNERLRTAQAKFDAIAGNKKIREFLENAQSLIKWQSVRTAAVKIAVLIGISIVGGMVGGMVARGVGGLFMRMGAVNAMGELGAGARIISAGAGMVTDTAIASAGKIGIYGGSYKDAFLENLIENLGSAAVMKVLSKNADELARAEAEASKFWSTKGGIVLKEGAAVTGHGLMGIALGYVSSKIVTGHGQPPPETLEEWLMQGASMAIGRYVGHQVNHRLDHIRKIAKLKDFARGEALLKFAVDVHQQALRLESKPSSDAAIDLMVKRHEVLKQEIESLEMIAKRPELLKQVGLTAGHIRAMQAEINGQIGEVHAQGLAELPLHLAGMREVVPGAVWKGSQDQIEHGLRSAERAGVVVTSKRNPTTKTWEITLDGRRMRVREQGSHAKQRHQSVAAEYKPRTVEADPVKGERSLATDFVPGSSFKGNTVKHADHAAEAAHAARLENQALGTAQNLIGLVKGVKDIRVGDGGKVLVVTLDSPVGGSAQGTFMTVEIKAGPLPDQQVALAVANPTKQGVTKVDGHELPIHGRHTIELSVHMNPDQVDRAVAGQLGTLVAAQKSMHLGKNPRGPAVPDGAPAPLGPTDIGRAAEINLLVAQMRRDPSTAAAKRTELVALVEHLGLRKGLGGADQRASILDEHLSREARSEVELARKPHDELDSAARAQLDKIEAAAWKDLEARTKAPKPGEVHAMPPELAPKGKHADPAKVVEAARIAARVREMVSERTQQSYRDRIRTLPPGEYLTVNDLQLGGGAALAARRPGALLVDARGRWQADGSKNIAQTGHQLDGLRDAGFGDPRQIAGPNERVPLEAIRYWEDTLAAQGEVINGTASFRTAPDGRLLVAIKPTDGSPEIVIAVKGTPTIATGFPTERAPGAAFGTNVAESILQVERSLAKAANDPKVPEVVRKAAQRAVTQLADIKSGGVVDGAFAHRVLEQALASVPEDVRPHLRGAMRGMDNHDVGHNDAALKTIGASNAWTDIKNNDAHNSAFLGDEANLEHIRVAATAKDAPKHWMIAGTGGTAISAAEIILAANPTAKVTMLGRESPAGLRENDQFRSVEGKYGPKGQKRFEVIDDPKMDLAAPKVTYENGRATYEAWSKKGNSADRRSVDKAYTGDGYIAALGREQQVPPMVADLILAARRAGGDNAVRYVPRFDKDNQYVGYVIEVRLGAEVKKFEVTGGASRFAPRKGRSQDPNAIGGEAESRINHASDMDAPSTSGNFDAGFVATATQAHRYAMDRKAREDGK